MRARSHRCAGRWLTSRRPVRASRGTLGSAATPPRDGGAGTRRPARAASAGEAQPRGARTRPRGGLLLDSVHAAAEILPPPVAKSEAMAVAAAVAAPAACATMSVLAASDKPCAADGVATGADTPAREAKAWVLLHNLRWSRKFEIGMAVLSSTSAGALMQSMPLVVQTEAAKIAVDRLLVQPADLVTMRAAEVSLVWVHGARVLDAHEAAVRHMNNIALRTAPCSSSSSRAQAWSGSHVESMSCDIQPRSPTRELRARYILCRIR